MKTIYLFITCILVQYVAFAQDGVNFRDLTYSWTATPLGAGHAKT